MGFKALSEEPSFNLSVSVPADLVSQLSVYGDEAAIMDVVAPKGWDCTASIGADGSETMACGSYG